MKLEITPEMLKAANSLSEGDRSVSSYEMLSEAIALAIMAQASPASPRCIETGCRLFANGVDGRCIGHAVDEHAKRTAERPAGEAKCCLECGHPEAHEPGKCMFPPDDYREPDRLVCECGEWPAQPPVAAPPEVKMENFNKWIGSSWHTPGCDHPHGEDIIAAGKAARLDILADREHQAEAHAREMEGLRRLAAQATVDKERAERERDNIKKLAESETCPTCREIVNLNCSNPWHIGWDQMRRQADESKRLADQRDPRKGACRACLKLLENEPEALCSFMRAACDSSIRANAQAARDLARVRELAAVMLSFAEGDAQGWKNHFWPRGRVTAEQREEFRKLLGLG